MTITAAADGSALGNPGPAGWAWYIDDDNWQAGGWKHATNNQGELKAVLELLRATAHVDDDLLILCDSQYVINCITKWMPGWKKKGWRKGDGKPVLNLELLQELDEAITGRSYRFEWVRGHVGHVLNEAADARARAVSEAFQRNAPIPTGPGFTVAPITATSLNRTGSPDALATRTTATTPATAATPATATTPATTTTQPLADLNEVTVYLTDEENRRLLERANELGVSAQDALRSLI
jgi:ribonuclease HI